MDGSMLSVPEESLGTPQEVKQVRQNHFFSNRALPVFETKTRGVPDPWTERSRRGDITMEDLRLSNPDASSASIDLGHNFVDKQGWLLDLMVDDDTRAVIGGDNLTFTKRIKSTFERFMEVGADHLEEAVQVAFKRFAVQYQSQQEGEIADRDAIIAQLQLDMQNMRRDIVGGTRDEIADRDAIIAQLNGEVREMNREIDVAGANQHAMYGVIQDLKKSLELAKTDNTQNDQQAMNDLQGKIRMLENKATEREMKMEQIVFKTTGLKMGDFENAGEKIRVEKVQEVQNTTNSMRVDLCSSTLSLNFEEASKIANTRFLFRMQIIESFLKDRQSIMDSLQALRNSTTVTPDLMAELMKKGSSTTMVDDFERGDKVISMLHKKLQQLEDDMLCRLDPSLKAKALKPHVGVDCDPKREPLK